MNKLTENNLETFVIQVLQKLGWEYVHGLAIAPDTGYAERESFEQIILTQRLRKAVARLNPHIPADAQEQAVQKVLRIYSHDMLNKNETSTLFHLRDTLLPKLMSGEVRVECENNRGVVKYVQK